MVPTLIPKSVALLPHRTTLYWLCFIPTSVAWVLHRPRLMPTSMASGNKGHQHDGLCTVKNGKCETDTCPAISGYLSSYFWMRRRMEEEEDGGGGGWRRRRRMEEEMEED